MPVCTSCNKENPDIYRFCQSCGTPLNTADVSPAKPGISKTRVKKISSEEIAGGVTCGSCNTINFPGMKFCRSCGSSLDVHAGQPGKVICINCGGRTAAGYKFCQNCGKPMPRAAVAEGPKVVSATPASSLEEAASNAYSATQSDVYNSAEQSSSPASLAAAEGGLSSIEAGATFFDQRNPAEQYDGSYPPAAEIQTKDADTAPDGWKSTPPAGVVAKEQIAQQAEANKESTGRSLTGSMASGKPLAKMILVNRDGSDGEIREIREEAFDLGRSSGLLTFSDDPFLSDRHCRFFLQNDKWIVQDLQSTNGVFVRLPKSTELSNGDCLLLGKQLFVVELLQDNEKHMAPAVEHGVLVFGTPLGEAWGRLKQITVAGVARDVYFLYRQTISLGREEGDFRFPDDEFMSRLHLGLSFDGKKIIAKDLGSSNGTYLKIRGKYELPQGSMLHIGDQLIRFELS